MAGLNWRAAFLSQARSDFALLERLNALNVEYCHRLHYLQMVTEKLAKALLTNRNSTEPPALSHSALVSMLRSIPRFPEIREKLGFQDAASFKRFAFSLLDIADKIEKLAPSLSGLSQPNPEYPWRDQATRNLVVPAAFSFPEFDATDPKMRKLDWLIRALLRVVV